MTLAVRHPLYEMPFVVAGSGNVAWHWPLMLAEAGKKVDYILARNIERGNSIANACNAKFCSSFKELPQQPLIVILAVSDSAIELLANQLDINGNILIHGSGSIGSESVGVNGGVFYPLQTFSKGRRIDYTKIPFLITAKNEALIQFLKDISKRIGATSQVCGDEQRKQLHLAAVIANNFTNHLAALSYELINDTGLNPKILHPLLEETISKLEELSPLKAQTGPASRGDMQVVEKQLTMLENYPNIQNVYRLLSQSIQLKNGEH
jgi:predicted short-subunit dehydrogenase-like oxidoreductase (DUF2520 family)